MVTEIRIPIHLAEGVHAGFHNQYEVSTIYVRRDIDWGFCTPRPFIVGFLSTRSLYPREFPSYIQITLKWSIQENDAQHIPMAFRKYRPFFHNENTYACSSTGKRQNISNKRPGVTPI